MKLKLKLLALATLALAGLAPSSARANEYYAKLIVSAEPTGGGKVYVSDSSTRPDSPADSKGCSQNTTTQQGDLTFYVWAEANTGYEFVKWDETGCVASTSKNTTYSLKASSSSGDGNTVTYTRKAYFRQLKTDSKTLTLNTGTASDAVWSPSDDFGSAPTINSSNPGVATVSTSDNKVTITAVGNGSATITAVSSTLNATYNVTVKTRYYGTLYVSVGQGSGTVCAAETPEASASGTHAASGTCEVHVDANATGQSKRVYVHATPASGYGFLGWSENGSDPANWPDNPDYFTLSDLSTDRSAVSRTINAVFGELFTVTLNQATGGAASISSSTPAASGSTITEIKPRQITATFSAEAAVGNEFMHWKIVQGGETVYETANPLGKTFSASATVTPEFKVARTGKNVTLSNLAETWTYDGETFPAGAKVVSVEPGNLVTAALVDGRLVITPGVDSDGDGKIDTIAAGTATVKVDTGTELVVFEITIEKPTYRYTKTGLGIDELWIVDERSYPDPDDHAISFTVDKDGIADAYQDGDKVVIKGTDKGTKEITVDAFYFTAVYTVTVVKPEEAVTLSKSIETCYLDTSAGDATPRTFLDIQKIEVAGTDPSMLTARQVGNYVQISTVKSGSCLVTVYTHLTNYLYTINVALAPVTENVNLATAESVAFDDYFDEISAIVQDGDSAGYVRVVRNGSALTVTGLKVGLKEFRVIGRRHGESGYSDVTFSVQVYDGSQGHIGFDAGVPGFTGAESARTIEVEPGVTNLVFVFRDPKQLATITIPDGFIAKADILAVGGGGAGGTQAKVGNGGGGGGAGGYSLLENVSLKGGEYGILVGKGGERAQAKMNPVAGNNGSDSVVTNASGMIVVSALGGGGGGASLSGNSDGIYGGSGGGAAWSDGVVGAYGPGCNGQGNYGGIPSEVNCGGGGGGADTDGNANGAGGYGKTSDISGVPVVYATGGAGGRSDVLGDGAAGVNPGDGGAGGNGSFGGGGADGVVIVRLTSLKKYIKVPVPKSGDEWFPTNRIEWADGKSVTAFNEALYNQRNQNAISYIDGIISTNCWSTEVGEERTLHGTGHYQFVIYLKDGYVWDDGTEYGTAGGKLFKWSLVADLSVIDATIDVNKQVEWGESGTNATIEIIAHATPEITGGGTPNVLFIGTLCGVHNLTDSTINQSLAAIVEKGNVDYRLYNSNEKYDDYSGSMSVGNPVTLTFKPTISQRNNNHAVLSKFYNGLYAAMTSGKAYDYIVLEFDGTQLAGGSYSANAHEAEVSAWLKGYYDEKKIIWVTDTDIPLYDPTKYLSAADLKNLSFPDHQPSTEKYYYCNNYGKNLDTIATANYKGLVGLLDPEQYGKNPIYRKQQSCNSYTVQVNQHWELQKSYNNAAALADFLRNAIVAKPANILFNDQAMSAEYGLTLDSVQLALSTDNNTFYDHIVWDPEGGVRYADPRHFDIPAELDVYSSSNKVTAVLTNIDFEVWARLRLNVSDNGTFKSSVDATWNPQTQQYEKDPNKGKARVSMIDDGGNELNVYGEAATSVAWKFNAYTIEGEAVNGEIFLNGMTNSSVAFAEGYNPTVSYRGDPGYLLKEVYVDGHLQTIDSTNMIYVLFRNLSAGHRVKAVFESVVGDIDVTDVRVMYDGHVHVPEVTLGENWQVENLGENVRIVFAPQANWPDDKWMTAEEAAAMTPAEIAAMEQSMGLPAGAISGASDDWKTVYYRVLVNQPGWGESGSLDEWGWKIAESGSGKVKIDKARLDITAKDQQIHAGDAVPQNGGVTLVGLVEGESEETALSGSYTFTSPDYKPATSQPDLYRLTPGGKTSANYEIVWHNGVLAVDKSPVYVNEVAQAPFLDFEATGVEGVEKTYDGVATNLVVKITPNPTSGLMPEGVELTWRADGATEWTTEMPTYADAGTYKVWYKVSDGDVSFLTSSNYQFIVINPREVTLESASGTWEFDGTTHSDNAVELIEGSFVEGEGFTANCLGRARNVGVVTNAFVVTITGGLESNYSVKHVDGLLVITSSSLVIGGVTQPQDPDPKFRPSPAYDEESGSYPSGVAPVEKVYDGIPTNLNIVVDKPKTGVRYLYTLTPKDPESWTSDFELVNVGTNAVWYAIEDEQNNFVPVTNFQFVTITKRPATVKAGDATKVYDGTPLVCGEIGEQTGFVEGESVASATMTAESSIVHVGTQANRIASVTPAEGTDLGNYALTFEDGLLEVTKRPVTLTSPTKSGRYMPGTRFSFLASEITADNLVEGEIFTYRDLAGLTNVGSCKADFTVEDGTALLADYEITKTLGDLILGKSTIYINGVEQNEGIDPSTNGVEDVDVVYDGEPHLPVIEISYPTPEMAEKAGWERTVKYSLDGTTWFTPENAPRAVIDVCTELPVWYAAEVSTYQAATNRAKVTIRQRPVTINAKSNTWTYDGEEHTEPGWEVEPPTATTGFVAGEGVLAVYMTGDSRITEVGNVPNSIDKLNAEFVEGTNPDNYYPSFGNGSLVVTPADLNPEVPVVEPRVYDGTGTDFVVTDDEIDDPVIRYSVDGGEFTDVPPSFTNANDYTVTYVVEDPSGNHRAVTNTIHVIINPREVVVTANPAQMRFGEAEPPYSATVTYADTREVLPAEEAAKIVYELGPDGALTPGVLPLVPMGEKVQGNYTVTYVASELLVSDKLPIAYTVGGNEVVYDGEGHGLEVTIDDPAVPGATVKYALSPEGPWYDSLPAATNVTGGVVIYYAVESSDPAYQSVTNLATVKVTARAATVKADDKTKKFGEDDPAFTATVTGLAARDEGKTDLFAYTFSRAPGEEPNKSYKISVTGAAEQGNYTLTFVDGKLQIESIENPEIGGREIDPEDPPAPADPEDPSENDSGVRNAVKVYDGVATNIEVVVTKPESGATVRYSTDGSTWSQINPTFTDAGTNKVWYTVSAPRYATVTNYAWVVVKPRPVTVEVKGATGSFVYNRAQQTVSGKTLTEDDPLYTTDKVAFAGTDSVSSTGVVEKKPMGLSADLFSNTDANFDVTFAVTDGWITVTPAPATVSVSGNSATKNYTGSELSVTGYTVTGCTVTGYDTVSDMALADGAAAVAKRTDVGTATMGLTSDSFVNSNPNYTVTFSVTDGALTVTPKKIAVAVAGAVDTKVYNGETQTASGFTATTEDPLYRVSNVTLADGALAKASRKDVGKTSMNLAPASFVNGDANFDVTFTVRDGSMTVTRAAATVTADDKSKTYGAGDPALTATVTGLFGDDTLVYTVTRAQGEDVKEGGYVITAAGDAQQGNYAVTYNPGVFTITKNSITVAITGNSASKVYNGDEQEVTGFTATAPDGSGYDVAKTVLASGKAEAKRKDVGETAMNLTVAQFANTDANYDVTYTLVEDGVLTVTRKEVVVQAVGASKDYGAEDPASFTATVTGLVDDYAIAYTLARDPGETPGQYPIRVTAAAEQGNYTVTTRNAYFIIADGRIFVSAPEIDKIYDGVTVSPTVTPSGEYVDFRVEYLQADGTWSTEPPVFKDVVATPDERTNVVFRVFAENCATVTNQTWVGIHPRPLTLQVGYGPNPALAKSKVYDGTPLWGEASDIQELGSGYAPGECFAYDGFTNKVDVGICPSWFTIADTETTKQSNYAITYNWGFLRVTPPEKAITVASPNGYWRYDGLYHPITAAEDPARDETPLYWSVSVDSDVEWREGDGVKAWGFSARVRDVGMQYVALNDFECVITNSLGEDVTDYYTNTLGYVLVKSTGSFQVGAANFTADDFVAENYYGVYDGQPAGALVTVVKEGVKDDPNTCVLYTTDRINWSTERPTWTHVTDGEKKVWFKIEAAEHNTYVGELPLTVEIRPRNVTFVSPDTVGVAPQTISTEVANVTSEGLVEGEGFTFTATASRSEVGVEDATFAYAAAAGTLASDYTVSVRYGQLIETDSSVLTVRAASKNFVYNGESQTWPVAEVIGRDGVTVTAATFDPASAITIPTTGSAFVSNVVTSVTLSAPVPGVTVTNFVAGKLTMSALPMPECTVVSTNVVYDGRRYGVEVIVPEGLIGDGTTVVAYNTSGHEAMYDSVSPTFREVANGGYLVYVKVGRRGYDPWYGVGKVMISPRPITITTSSLTEAYDGLGHTTVGDAGAVALAAGSTLADGDYLVPSETHTLVAVTNVCTTPNTFVFAIRNNEFPGVDQCANYAVSASLGSLTVEPYPFVPTVTVEDKDYDGNKVATYKSIDFGSLPIDGGATATDVLKLGEDGMPLSFGFVSEAPGKWSVTNDVPLLDRHVVAGRADVMRTNYRIAGLKVLDATIRKNDPGELDPGREGGVSAYDGISVYDGAKHTFDLDALTNALNDVDFLGNDWTLAYALTEDGEWTSDPEFFRDVVETPTSFWYRVSVPGFEDYVHAVGVTVTQRVVEVTSATESWTYDGNAHGAASASVTAGSFADGEGFDASDFATITAAGSVDNTFTCTLRANTKASNYLLTTVNGKLTVTPKTVAPGTNLELEPIDDIVYDGEAHEPEAAAWDTDRSTVIGGDMVSVVWLDNVDATNEAKAVYTFSGNYAGVVTNLFRILPREVTLTSGDGTWTYDGAAHGNESVTVSGRDGFVDGEGVTTNGFATVTAVTAGTPNTFAYAFDETATKSRNYKVTVVPGTLVVNAASVPSADHEPGTDEEGDYPPSAGPLAGPNTDDPPPSPLNSDGEPRRLSDFDTTVVYDGEAHTFDLAGLEAKLAESEFHGNTPVVEYSADGLVWVAEPFAYTDVTETPASFWYRVSAPNYGSLIHAVAVTVTQRVVEVTSASDEWTFDAHAHSNLTVTVTRGSFVEGEGIATNAASFAKITSKGQVPNRFTYSWLEGTDPANYDFSVVTGKLTVVAKEAGDGTGDLRVAPVDAVMYYNGTDRGPKPRVTDVTTEQTYVLKEGSDFDYSYFANRNATNDAKVVVTFKGNYAGAITNSFTILPRTVVLTSGTEDWTYDGAAHSNLEVTSTEYTGVSGMVDTGFGFVPGEGVTTNGFASIVDVGTVDNTFSWNWAEGTLASNYVMGDAVYGTLTVTKAVPPQSSPTEDPDDPSEPKPAGYQGTVYDWYGVFDGEEHTVLDPNVTGLKPDGLEAAVTWSLDPDGPFTEVKPGYTDVTNKAPVYIRIDAGSNYSVVYTNGFVTITQRVVTVTADDKTKAFGEADPAFTATVENLVGDDKVVYTFTREAGEASGASYAITPYGETDQGNYRVVYVPGTLTIGGPEVHGLWITDHADGGPGKVHLAFTMERASGAGLSVDYVRALAESGKIKVAWGATEEELAEAEPVVATPHADAEALGLKTGWVWITVTLPEDAAFPLLYKVLITD